jgi:hypothetical protein
MAIIVEEGEKKNNTIAIIEWLVLLCVAGAAVYYIFFAQPQLVTIPAAGNVGMIAPITQAALQPNTILQSPLFMTLTSTVALPSSQGPALVGRADPFIAP